jgi:hypothetical protein
MFGPCYPWLNKKNGQTVRLYFRKPYILAMVPWIDHKG